MTPPKTNPDKQSTIIRIHNQVAEKLKAAHAKHIGKTGKVISLVDFADQVILAGLKSVNKKSKY
jgi:hypothetical protein